MTLLYKDAGRALEDYLYRALNDFVRRYGGGELVPGHVALDGVWGVLDVVWGYAAFPTTRTVDNHIASLRSKLERDPEEPRWIKTVHGVGYKLEMPNPE